MITWDVYADKLASKYNIIIILVPCESHIINLTGKALETTPVSNEKSLKVL